jgi:hypothetical protein
MILFIEDTGASENFIGKGRNVLFKHYFFSDLFIGNLQLKEYLVLKERTLPVFLYYTLFSNAMCNIHVEISIKLLVLR